MSKLYKKLARNDFMVRCYKDSFLSGFMHWCVKVMMFFEYKPKSINQFLLTVPRRLGFKDKRYMSLKGYRNKYSGKRCFIACTGPSLSIEDLESLKNEYVFGMNSICLIHDKTEWKPDFFGVQDNAVFEKVKDAMLSTDNGVVFLPHSYKEKYPDIPNNWVSIFVCGAYHLYEAYALHKYFSKFSYDCYECIYDGYSITYTLIQLAVYMGFKEIYLLGADSNYLGEKQHFIEHGHYASNTDIATDRLINTYEQAKKSTEAIGVNMFNATRGGMLEVFPRVNLDDVIKNIEKNKIAK